MKVLLTGASGYVGGMLQEAFTRRHWIVLRPHRADSHPWRLPDEVNAVCFEGCDALVHCAWDMRPFSPEDAHRTNVLGSRRLVQQAREAGVERIIFISSMSAYTGCQSTYGSMKLEVEQEVLSAGGVVVRPGLVYGAKPGGMMGKLMDLVAKLPVIPLPCADARQYLVDEETLAAFTIRAASEAIPSSIYSLANPQALSMQEIVSLLASALGRRVFIFPVPWRLAYLGLWLARACGIRLPVTSDNLLGLARSNPSPDFSSLRPLNVQAKLFPDGMTR